MTLMPARRDAHAVDQLPELPARQRIDAGGRLVEDQKIGIVDERAAQPEFLPHAARQLLRRPIGERAPARCFATSSAIRQSRSAARLPEQPAEELDILADAEVGIEVLARALAACRRCAGRPRRGARRPPCRRQARRRGRIAICRAPAMMLSSVDLPTPSGPISPTMQPAGSATVTPSSAADPAVTLRDVLEPRDGAA